MTARALARRYATALVDVASAAGRREIVARDFAAFAGAVLAHPELEQFFGNGGVPASKKRAVVDALLAKSGETAVEVRRLLSMLADRDRLSLLREIARAVSDRVMTADRVVEADVATAVPLAPDRVTALAGALSRATGQRVTVSARVDPSLIGGVVARVGSMVFDGSVQRQLVRMRQKLLTEA